MLDRILRFFLDQPLVAVLLLAGIVAWGLSTAPFPEYPSLLPRNPVPVDAIPDIGENQQIVFAPWPGRSPRDVEDQVTYPLTTSLLGLPGVRTIRSTSAFGFASIYVIFEEGVDYYWSRSRILEKLNALPRDLLPDGVSASLGPDATALGQVYWYTLEGHDAEGRPVGGWDLHELRSIQDFQVKYALGSVRDVAEVASIGGYVREYQVDVDPEAMRTYGVSLERIIAAVRKTNRDVGARTMEINRAEYLVRGLGQLDSVEALAATVVAEADRTPILLSDLARVTLGPAERRGALDKEGAPAVGGVVVARYGANPLEVIEAVKERVLDLSVGLPTRMLDDGTVSKVTIVPFYDRTRLIHETLGTLEEALQLEILVTILVVLIMVANLRVSFLISGLLPVAVLMSFVAMRQFGVEANVVALSGIAIAIGTMVDLGIILTENLLRHLDEEAPGQDRKETVFKAASEVAPAILTAVLTTIVSFLPVFALQEAEGKLFRPLAYTKTFALLAALCVTLTLIPPFAAWAFRRTRPVSNGRAYAGWILLAMAGLYAAWRWAPLAGGVLAAWALIRCVLRRWPPTRWGAKGLDRWIVVGGVVLLLARFWLPLGAGAGFGSNLLFVAVSVFGLLGGLALFRRVYDRLLAVFLRRKALFLVLPISVVLLGVTIWQGAGQVFAPVLSGLGLVGLDVQDRPAWQRLTRAFPGMGREFMPSLDEGSFLLMPTSMPHAGMEENLDVLRQLDMAVAAIPEVETVVGKLGRVSSALDPAPISMYENLIAYRPEYIVDERGRRERFRVSPDGDFVRDSLGQLVPDPRGKPFRQWRPSIRDPDDIWSEIAAATRLPGVTGAPRLQPIETRLVMLQTGMRSPMGIKVSGPDLERLSEFGQRLEPILKSVPSIDPASVFAERVVGKPYLLLDLDRDAMARYGLHVDDVQRVIEVGIGGIPLTTTIEGRERYPVRVRFPRERRDAPEDLLRLPVSTPDGAEVPLGALVDLRYERGPQVIKSENTFPVAYVVFDKRPGTAEVEVVEQARAKLAEAITDGRLVVPAGVTFAFAGSYENQLRASKRLGIIVPLALATIFLILYFQFRSAGTALMVFAGVALAFSGAFLLLWCYGQPGFLDVPWPGEGLRDVFGIHTVNLSVAVWVGFIALFGIATDDGVVMATYLDQTFAARRPDSTEAIRAAVRRAAGRRVRPALMTSATTLLALLPILTSSGRGSDIMIPMAIPAFGGMLMAVLTLFLVPVLYAWRAERTQRRPKHTE